MPEKGPGNNIPTVTEDNLVVPFGWRNIMKGQEIIILLKWWHGTRQLGLCDKVTRKRIWLIIVTKYSTSKTGNVKSSGIPTMDMCHRVHFVCSSFVFRLPHSS